jgi:hypothetical protein
MTLPLPHRTKYGTKLSVRRYVAGVTVSPNFRLCTQEDMMRVLEIVESTSTRQAKMGWFDQYGSLMNGPNVKDVVLALDNGAIVAAALTYTPSCGSPIASNLPWAGRIGNDVGGVTCICISRKWIFLFHGDQLRCSDHHRGSAAAPFLEFRPVLERPPRSCRPINFSRGATTKCFH